MMLWHEEDAPESVLSAQCPPLSAALARLILSPSPSALPRTAGPSQGRLLGATGPRGSGQAADGVTMHAGEQGQHS